MSKKIIKDSDEIPRYVKRLGKMFSFRLPFDKHSPQFYSWVTNNSKTATNFRGYKDPYVDTIYGYTPGKQMLINVLRFVSCEKETGPTWVNLEFPRIVKWKVIIYMRMLDNPNKEIDVVIPISYKNCKNPTTTFPLYSERVKSQCYDKITFSMSESVLNYKNITDAAKVKRESFFKGISNWLETEVIKYIQPGRFKTTTKHFPFVPDEYQNDFWGGNSHVLSHIRNFDMNFFKSNVISNKGKKGEKVVFFWTMEQRRLYLEETELNVMKWYMENPHLLLLWKQVNGEEVPICLKAIQTSGSSSCSSSSVTLV